MPLGYVQLVRHACHVAFLFVTQSGDVVPIVRAVMPLQQERDGRYPFWGFFISLLNFAIFC